MQLPVGRSDSALVNSEFSLFSKTKLNPATAFCKNVGRPRYRTSMIHVFISLLSIFIGTTEVRGTEAAALIFKVNPQILVQKGKKYTAIRDGLYKDDKGNLYFRAKDWSDEGLAVDRYIYVVYSERFEPDGIKDMKWVIDPDTFKAMGSSYYKDKNNIYYFKVMSDGGTMALVDDADRKSFKIVRATPDSDTDAKDNRYSYYQGSRIKK